MPVRIRLARYGRKKICRYRIVAADKRMKRDGRFLETLGTYDPQAQPKAVAIKTERMAYWLKQGAEPSETVSNLLKEERFDEKLEAMEKGLDLQSLSLEKKPERKRKAKPRRAKKSG